MATVKPFKQENQWSYLYKKQEMRNTYKPHQQTTNNEHQVPDYGQVQINAAGLNVLISA